MFTAFIYKSQIFVTDFAICLKYKIEVYIDRDISLAKNDIDRDISLAENDIDRDISVNIIFSQRDISVNIKNDIDRDISVNIKNYIDRDIMRLRDLAATP